MRNNKGGGYYFFLKKGFHVVKIDNWGLFLLSFFISISLLGTWMDHIERDVRGIKEGVTIEDVSVERLLPAEARQVVEELALRYQKLPVEPRLDKNSGIITAEEDGIIIDTDQTLLLLEAAPPGSQVELVKVKISTRHRSQDLLKASQPLGSYATWFHGSSERRQNITTALNSLNNTVLWPGDVFSFNEITGPRTPERGYLPAPIILNGEYDVGYGGGVCQVSSTAYNAALLAGLPILERHGHTKPVHYVPEDHDAAVNYGYLDLKFQNSRSGPLIIKAAYQNGRISVEIRGERY